MGDWRKLSSVSPFLPSKRGEVAVVVVRVDRQTGEHDNEKEEVGWQEDHAARGVGQAALRVRAHGRGHRARLADD